MSNSNNSRPSVPDFLSANWLAVVLIVVMGAFIYRMCEMLALPNLSQREVGLITFILTAASVIASVLATKIYADSASSQTLRDHGVQIASGIFVLKRQIEGLSDWVDEKRGLVSSRPEPTANIDGILEHVEHTLNGFRELTDAALGGIGGVIGDALAQYEAVMGQIANTRAEAQIETKQIEQEMQSAESPGEFSRLEARISEVTSRAEKRIAELARSSAIPIPSLPARRQVSVGCPRCGEEQNFDIPDRVGETRVRYCVKCAARFNVHIGAERTVLVRDHGSSPRMPGNFDDERVDSPLWLIRNIYIEPDQLRRIFETAVSLDLRSKEREHPVSPAELLQATLTELEGTGISRAKIRRLFLSLYRSRAFQFAVGDLSFRSRYLNRLSMEGLVDACAQSYVWVLSGLRPVQAKDAPYLATEFFGGQFAGGETAVATAISRLPLERSPSTAQAVRVSAVDIDSPPTEPGRPNNPS